MGLEIQPWRSTDKACLPEASPPSGTSLPPVSACGVLRAASGGLPASDSCWEVQSHDGQAKWAVRLCQPDVSLPN